MRSYHRGQAEGNVHGILAETGVETCHGEGQRVDDAAVDWQTRAVSRVLVHQARLRLRLCTRTADSRVIVETEESSPTGRHMPSTEIRTKTRIKIKIKIKISHKAYSAKHKAQRAGGGRREAGGGKREAEVGCNADMESCTVTVDDAKINESPLNASFVWHASDATSTRATAVIVCFV